MFEDGSREPLHGHNYRVQIKGEAPELIHDMVFDFLDIKPIVRRICDSLDHKVLIPGNCPYLQIKDDDQNWQLITKDESYFSLPKKDTLILDLSNTSAERLAIYLCQKIREQVQQEYGFEFSQLEVEVEETPGQSAVYVFKAEKKK